MWYPQLPIVRDLGFKEFKPNLYGRGSSINSWATHMKREIHKWFS